MDNNLSTFLGFLRNPSSIADAILTMDTQLTTATNNVNTLASQILDLQNQLAMAKAGTAGLQVQLTDTQNQVSDLQTKLTAATAQNNSAQDNIAALNSQIIDLNQQIANLTAKLNSAPAPTSTTRILTAFTPLSDLTKNNTSAADSFKGQTNGNVPPGNISNVPITELLDPALRSKPVFAHVQPWWGGNGGPGSPNSYHGFFSVGYDSADPAQIDKQANDMIARGYSGVIIEYQGRAGTGSVSRDHENLCAINWLRRCESSGGKLKFMLCLVKGDYEYVAAETDPAKVAKRQAEIVLLLQYVWATFAQSGAYFQVNGKPVVHWFDVLDAYNMQALVAAAPKLAHVFRNVGGYTKSQVIASPSSSWKSDGAFSWFGSQIDVYKAAASFPTLITFASVAPGFNDSLSPWGQNRITPPAQGAYWLSRFSEINQYFAAKPDLLDAIQAVTWSDYHEATEVETGIDGGLAVTVSLTGSTLSWKCAGNPAAVHHFNVYISADGVNAALVAQPGPSLLSFDLSQMSLAKGSYQFYVQAVGQPGILNALSAPATISV